MHTISLASLGADTEQRIERDVRVHLQQVGGEGVQGKYEQDGEQHRELAEWQQEGAEGCIIEKHGANFASKVELNFCHC
tara:strand:+ start:491 stop:727 length:237 start_codon:yes stop_codon:yes gene_type:complete